MSHSHYPPPSSLKVSIRPLQSSFFAGEDFTCQITFINTNPRVAHTQPLVQAEFAPAASSQLLNDTATRRVVSALPTHAKSRSVDVRALGRQHESDSASDSPQDPSRRSNLLRHLDIDDLPHRRNLIGKAAAPSHPSSNAIHPWSVSPRIASTKSSSHRSTKSVAALPQKNGTDLGLGRPTAPPAPAPATHSNPSSPNPPSRLSSLPSLGKRTTSAPIAPNHSHSRKKSVAQLQAEDLTEAFELDSLDPARSTSGISSPTSHPPSPWRANSNGDANQAASFYGLGRNDTMESVFRESITDWSQSRRPSIPRSPSHSPIYPPPEALPPGTEKILWSFAQLAGTIEIDESLIKPGDFENLKHRLAYGDLTGASASPLSVPGTPRTLGGGHLAQAADSSPPSSGWSNLLRSSFSSRPHQHRRTGSTFQDAQERTLQSRSVPTFSTPPSIVAVDLLLPPGESKTFEFKLRLPVDLPPSYLGKAIRLKYTLTLGTNRFDTAATATRGRPHTSRLIQVPIRVYNHVGASGFRPFFDLMNPVILTKEEASVTAVDTDASATPSAPSLPKRSTKAPQIQRQELESYVKQLLTKSESASTVKLDSAISAPTSQGSGCKAAVEALARSSGKVSYDISKDGKVAAVLTLVRSRYRLGETITGVININNHTSLARIARISATLETFEEVQPSIATLPAGRLQRATRIVHAEHHESVLDKGRASFSLSVPSGATPEFVTSGVKLNWLVKLAFLTISATSGEEKAKPPPHLMPSSADGFSRYHISLRGVDSLAGSVGEQAKVGLKQMGCAAETKLETVECAVPVSILPNSTSFKVGDAEFYA